MCFLGSKMLFRPCLLVQVSQAATAGWIQEQEACFRKNLCEKTVDKAD